MRTQDEIAKRFEAKRDGDMFGFEIGEYLRFLDWDHIKKYAKEDTKKKDWTPDDPDPENVKKIMLDYMEFAWMKAKDCRGISASRSMSHYMGWVWMLGDEEVEFFGDLTDYEYYGKDNLVKICERYGWDHTQWDDGVRVNSEMEL